MASSSLVQAPMEGQVVRVRQRLYIVSQVAKSNINYAQLNEKSSQSQNLVTLTSIEDDAIGETLQIIWELEPGAQLVENSELPYVDGFDAPTT